MTPTTMFRFDRPTRDTAKDFSGGDGGEALGDLPEWNLSDLYPGMDSPELNGDMERVEAECMAFAGRYEGKLAGLAGERLPHPANPAVYQGG